MASGSVGLTQRRTERPPFPNEKHSEPSLYNGQNNDKVQAVGKKKELLIDNKDIFHNACCHPEKNLALLFFKISACFVAGLVFGIALQKGRVFEPEVIRDQMVFRRWILVKMFLAAMATGQLSLATLSILPIAKYSFKEAAEGFRDSFNGKGLLSSSLGPFLLGMGMTLAGACPGMVLAQVGSFTKNSGYTYLGALFGALVFGLVHPLIAPLLRPSVHLKTQTIHEKLEVSYAKLAFVTGICIMLVVGLLESLIPWQSDLPLHNTNQTDGSLFTWVAWPPAVAGILTGVLQVIFVLAVKDTMGGSSSYQTLVSQWVTGPSLRKRFTYMATYTQGISNWWQVVFVFGVMCGALMSSVASGMENTTKGVPIPLAFIGGAFMLFGARFASGCTSGHGISGVGLLFWLSWVAVPCMFAGGISTAFILQAVGHLDTYDIVLSKA